MATPVFKFQHPDLPGEDLYFIHNTFFELPATIPMDLTTFIWYHYKIGRTLEGFLYCWDNLNEFQASLEGESFENFFDEGQRKQLYDDAKYAFTIQEAINNVEVSEKIRNFINQKKYDTQDLKSYFYDIIKDLKINFREIIYYISRHELIEYLWDCETDFSDIDVNDEEALIEIWKNNPFELCLIPHRFRMSGFFQYQCIIREEYHLLPNIYYDNKQLIRDICIMNYPNELAGFNWKGLFNDSAFVEEIVQINGNVLCNVPEEYQNNREVVKKAINSIPYSIMFASNELKNNKEIAILAFEAGLNEFGEDFDSDGFLEIFNDEIKNEIKDWIIKKDYKYGK
jgi:hypothetical protein